MKKVILFSLVSIIFGGCSDSYGNLSADSFPYGYSNSICYRGYLFIKSSGYSDSVIQVFENINGVSLPMKCAVGKN